MIDGASADADRATAAEPEVSALRDGIPSAEWPCVLRASGEMLPDAIRFLGQCGGRLERVEVEAGCYRIEFFHDDFWQTEVSMVFLRNRGSLTIELRSIGPLAECAGFSI